MVSSQIFLLFGVVVMGQLVSPAHSSKLSNKQLIQMATEQQTPFSESSLKRLQGTAFGHARAPSSSDVVIFNKMDKTFRLKGRSCEAGEFSKELYPETLLAPKSGFVYGMDSAGPQGAVICAVVYEEMTNDQKASTGAYIQMDVENKVGGYNGVRYAMNGTYDVVSILGQGNNNQVQFHIQQ